MISKQIRRQLFATSVLVLCGGGTASAAGNIVNAPERSGDTSITQIYGGGSMLLRGGQIGAESATIDSVRVCASGVGKHADITNAPKRKGKTTVVGGRNVNDGAVEYGC